MKEFLLNISGQFSGVNIQTKSFIASFVFTVFLGLIIVPILRKLKVGQVVRDDGPQSHLKKTGTPTMGGIIMLIVAIVVSVLVGLKHTNILPVTMVTLGFGLIGFIDDFKKLVLKNPKGLSPKLKMIGLIIVSCAFVGYLLYSGFGTDMYIPIIKTYINLPVVVYFAFMVFTMVACTNSLNLTDGLDGLASGVTAIIMIFFIFVSMAWGNKEMSTFSAIIAGSTIGLITVMIATIAKKIYRKFVYKTSFFD